PEARVDDVDLGLELLLRAGDLAEDLALLHDGAAGAHDDPEDGARARGRHRDLVRGARDGALLERLLPDLRALGLLEQGALRLGVLGPADAGHARELLEIGARL